MAGDIGVELPGKNNAEGLVDPVKWRQHDQSIANDAARAWESVMGDPQSLSYDQRNDAKFKLGFLEGVEHLSRRTRVDEFLAEFGILNRKGIEGEIQNEAIKIEQNDPDAGQGFIVVFMDINGLKLVNDNAGHTAGDRLIFSVGGVLKSTFRQDDKIAHISGDEMACVIRAKDLETAQMIMNAYRTTREGTEPGVIAQIKERAEAARQELKKNYPNWPEDTEQKHPGQIAIGWHFLSASDFLKRYQSAIDHPEAGKTLINYIAPEADDNMYRDKNAKISPTSLGQESNTVLK